jgi:hypothetical protein
MLRTDIIQKFINHYGYKSYLEIGVNDGENFNKIKIRKKKSIDPALGKYEDANPTYKMTSDEYFEKYPKLRYDIIFIDGLHHSKQVDKDIENSLKVLNDGGTIVVHDCNPICLDHQVVPRVKKGIWNGDVWKSFVKFNFNNHQKYDCFVINSDHGCGIIREGMGSCFYDIPSDFTYGWLEKNRKAALNLIDPNQLDEYFYI